MNDFIFISLLCYKHSCFFKDQEGQKKGGFEYLLYIMVTTPFLFLH